MKVNKETLCKKAAQVILVSFLLTIVGCYIPSRADKEREGLFVSFEVIWQDPNDSESMVLVDRNTGVLYYQVISRYRYGITPIFNADGSPLIYSDFMED